MTYTPIFIKKVAKSGRGYLFWIPKDVSDFLSISSTSMIEFVIKKVDILATPSQELTFTKKPSPSKQGFLIWIPKNIIEFQNLDESSFVEVKARVMTNE